MAILSTKLWRRLPVATALAMAAMLSACTSLSLGTAAKLRALDYLNDDIASLVVAFDVPVTLEPFPDASILSFDLTTEGQGERHVNAVLTRADAGDLTAGLPPPSDGRTYYIFGFSDADKTALREAQVFARGLAASGNTLMINVAPRFCAAAAIKPESVRFSVLIALPGATALEPLISNETLANVLASSGGQLPACAGHSG